ncbi:MULTISPECIES: fasciclin domain-containing protein [Sulfitobacter]|jgi:uncharacterized surface protein with fasciclin (FAS1) repeats|uniref:fasciclin domain-containing protein n=1 Tax=Sulfitobacter TaxID=60136 RepID=UPI0000668DA5|nr:fasciclin domain-containing protein [Sulfitobacter sp. EE-36]EAP85298.1 hypothetical protein EE36_05203 [Sulfitobacter sp. EE-36]
MTFAKKMMTATAALALTAGAAFADEMKNPMVGGAEMFADKNIVENAVNSADHTTLVAAVKAAGLVDTLAGEGPFTVFAPTNAGFDRLEPGTVEMLVKPENKERLTEILTCHVVGKAVMSDALQGMIKDDGGEHPVPTLGGCTLQASYADDGRMKLVDENGNAAFVEIADVKQSNGVIHVIDGVMLPKQ